ncbi:MAG: DNA repair exonuclease [Pseudomonadota bacterium]
MRLLVSADIHLGSPIRSLALRNSDLAERLGDASRETFRGIVDLAIDENCDVLVLSGDIFDSEQADLRIRAFLVSQLSRAAAAGIQTVLIRGNHDALLDHRQHGELGDSIHLLRRGQASVDIAGVSFHGLSFESAHEENSLLPDYPAPVADRLNVGLMHTSLGGAVGHDPYAPCSEPDLMAHGYDLWCLGHIHAPSERHADGCLAVMPGIPQPRDFGERAGGSVTLVDLGPDGPRFERRAVARLVFREKHLDLDACETQQEVFTLMRDTLSALGQDGRAVAVRLIAATERFPEHALLDMAAEVLEDIDGVFIDKVRAAPPAGRLDPAIDDFVRLMREEMCRSAVRAAAEQIVRDIRAVLPADLQDDLATTDLDDLREDALAEVHLEIRMGGGA